MLLFNVRVNVTERIEAAWNDWHFTHMPHLISTPGYLSARRYLSVTPGAPRYAALYEIDEEALPELLGEDMNRRLPLTVIDGPKFEAEILSDVDHFAYSVYVPAEPVSETLVQGDLPYVEVRYDVDASEQADVVRFLSQEIVPKLSDDPRIAGARAYHALADNTIPWLGDRPTPLVMLLVQVRDPNDLESVAAELRTTAESNSGANAHEMSVAAYRQVARYWPMPSDLYPAYIGSETPAALSSTN